MLKDELSSLPVQTPLETPKIGELPGRLRLLCVGPTEPSWVSLTLQLDAAGGIEPQFRWASSANQALTLLRDDSFDAVLIAAVAEDGRTPAMAEGAALVKAIRASGCEDPIVLMAPSISDSDWWDLSWEECELLQSSRLWNSAALVSILKRAILRTERTRQSRRLEIDQTKRMARERDEAEQLLTQQRRIIDALDARDETRDNAHFTRQAMFDCFGRQSTESANRPRPDLPPEINSYYQELLRTYVIMGSGNLATEIAKLAELLAVAGCGPREALSLHLERVETLVGGLGNRSTRHILARADLLALELMIHLGESYRRRLLA